MYEVIVVGTDGSPTAGEAVRRAAALAAATGAHLHVVSAWSPGSMPYSAGPEAAYVAAHGVSDWSAEMEAGVGSMLAELRGRLAGEGVRVSTHSVRAHPVAALLQAAKQHGAELIVVGNKGMKGVRRVLGSVPNDVAHKADCDVLIVNTT